jgi:hypothetical protein
MKPDNSEVAEHIAETLLAELHVREEKEFTALDVLRETPRFQSLLRKIGPAETRRSGPIARVSGAAKRV